MGGVVDRTRGLARRVALGTATAAGALLVTARTTPWPSALLVRAVFDRGAARASAALERHVPSDLVEVVDEAYDIASPDGRLDVFRPPRDEALPTVVWVHGGAFVSGCKGDVANYLRVLAGRGLTTVGVDYSIAPGSRYPTPVRQVAAALAHLVDHADRLGVDPGRIVLAGDSAGAQIAAQVALLVSDPAYAEDLGIDVDVPAEALKGLVLFCGAYDFTLAQGSTRIGSWLVDTAVWSYLGSSRRHDERTTRQGSIPGHVSPSFPPSFVSAGNGDPLLPHTTALVEALGRHGVDHDTLLFDETHEPRLGHEFQFDLDSVDGRRALDRAVAFIERVAG
ncbi:alpha/beta hydrolase [Terrabacter aerolatus]|uniref:Lipase n=1 Tax=Terrabacter aerolatus TaxID=422442 RepID=A0A512D4V5_9MICO|nr:alpha/beta hydrolase [Terrabacter aerolatus]GEO31492.1 lipase [Terrabacter aerolatus]